MRFVGLDVHKRVIEAAIIDEQGKLLLRERFDASREALVAFAETHLGADTRLALEATTNTWGVVDVLEPHVAEIVPSNPMRTKAIACAKVKTDKVDALVLAQLLRCDFLPRVWRPDHDTRQQRQLATHRTALVQDRTRLKNRIHAVLHQRLIHAPVKDLFNAAGRAWLESLELDPVGRHALESHLRQLDAVEAEIEQTMGFLSHGAWRDERIKLLMSLPGVDVTVAQALVAVLGDVSRFPDADKAAGYLGLTPSVKQSADSTHHGRITKQGKSHARWLLVQAAQHLDRHPGPIGVFFRRLLKRKKRNVAVVATARKLVTIAYHMLKNNEPYRYAQPRATDAKLSRLRIRAGGGKKKTGSRKGKPRPAHHGSGQRFRTVPALDAVYESEGLPAICELKPGERRMLEEHGVAEFAQSVRQEQKVPRKSS